jgi:sulfur carrier protein
MRVRVNGESRDLDEGATVRDVVALLDLPAEARGVAVAVDAEVVPRGAWDDTEIADGAHVEVLTAIQGG